MAARAHHGRSGGHRAPARSGAGRARARGRRRPRAAARAGGASGSAACSLWARTMARSESVVLPGREAGGQPVAGTAWAGPRRPRPGSSRAQSRAQRAARAARTRRSAAPWTRSSHASSTPAASPAAVRTSAGAGARLWTPADAGPGCGSARRQRAYAAAAHLGAGPRPAAVAAQRVQPLVGGDQAQRQVGVRGDDHRLRRPRGTRSARSSVGRRWASRRRRRSSTWLVSAVGPAQHRQRGRVAPADVDDAGRVAVPGRRTCRDLPAPETMPSSVRRMSITRTGGSRAAGVGHGQPAAVARDGERGHLGTR